MSTSTIVARASGTGHHVLKIDGYSNTKAMVATGNHIASGAFSVGGRRWCIRLYPNGSSVENAGWISVTLQLDGGAAVKAQFRISLLDDRGEPVPSHSYTSRVRSFPAREGKDAWGYHKFIRSQELEGSEHLRNDRFAVRCDVTVMTDLHRRVERSFVDVPPSDLDAHLGRLLASKDGADVVFKVGDESFAAHRCVLAARSPVFKEELFGSMAMEAAKRCVEIGDMDPRAFEALLHFIYTDALPEMASPAVTRLLVAAADRYQVERLKLVCEDRLSRQLDNQSKTSQYDPPLEVAKNQQRHHQHRPRFRKMWSKFLKHIGPER